uniref:Uncharacterized protein n=1 Tax=Caenorhabditis japonica TaxID=281687 RepID=A0A8R1HLN7_CAEJA
MTGTIALKPIFQKWYLPRNKPKPCSLCEVCFKPFSLANIDTHLEAGCAAEIYARYNMTPEKVPVKKEKSLSRKNKISKNSRKIKPVGKTEKRGYE